MRFALLTRSSFYSSACLLSRPLGCGRHISVQGARLVGNWCGRSLFTVDKGMAGGNAEDKDLQPQMYPKTHAKELYCLTDKDLEPLNFQEKRNPYVRKSTPMKLYKQNELEDAAVQRWGSLEEMEKEKQARIEKKEKRAQEKTGGADVDDEEAALRGGEGPGNAHPVASTVDENGDLHPLIKERIKKLATKKSSARKGKYVLYWMSTAIRDHENPALDAAAAEAKNRGLPLIIASFLLGSHTYPTHRRYKFMLEGLQDTQKSFQEKGVPHLVFLEGVSQPADRKEFNEGFEAVIAAASNADLVVTELMPTPPYHGFTERLVDQVGKDADVWAVDTACVVPMLLLQKAYAKAYAYRSTTGKWRKERLADLPYPSDPVEGDTEKLDELKAMIPWSSIDLTDKDTDILKLLEESSAVDQTVPGIDHMPGGQVAGYKRWNVFKTKGIGSYAARRNNPMLRVARDAARSKVKGAEKFADEFMTWRELAYSYCYHNASKLESFEVLPQWSQKTLRAHNGDKRELKTLEQMEKGETGDEIWDALQYQLNTTGELHNNVRMTWGKAPLRWTADAETAFKQTFHLNHKFALDGCDPSSYGGILWCYGQFDGPKGSESTPIFGQLRNRPTHWLTKKINPERYRALPIEDNGKANDGEACGGKDIRSLFGQAGHAAPEHSSDGHSDFENGAGEEEAEAASPKSPASGQKRKASGGMQSPAPATQKRKSSGGVGPLSPQRSGSGKQAGIQSFFQKKAK